MIQLSRSAVLSGYAALTQSLGADPYRLATGQGLPLSALTDPDQKVPSAAVVRLLEETAEITGARDFGLRLAATRRLSNLGAVGLVAQEQPNLRAAMDAIANHSWAQIEGVLIELEDADDLVVVHTSFTLTDIGTSRQATELLLAVLCSFIARRQAPGWRPEMVLFRHPAPPAVAPYLGPFGAAPLFSQPHDALVVRREDMNRPLPDTDPARADQLAAYLHHVAGGRRTSFADAVRELVTVLLPRGACSVRRVAAQLGVDRRTLARRLAAQGLSFEAVVLDVRLALARGYLASGDRKLQDIADLLGFSGGSAFSRWKRRHQLSLRV